MVLTIYKIMEKSMKNNKLRIIIIQIFINRLFFSPNRLECAIII